MAGLLSEAFRFIKCHAMDRANSSVKLSRSTYRATVLPCIWGYTHTLQPEGPIVVKLQGALFWRRRLSRG